MSFLSLAGCAEETAPLDPRPPSGSPDASAPDASAPARGPARLDDTYTASERSCGRSCAAWVRHVVPASDGRVFVIGTEGDDVLDDHRSWVTVVGPEGAIDPSFGEDGFVVLPGGPYVAGALSSGRSSSCRS